MTLVLGIHCFQHSTVSLQSSLDARHMQVAVRPTLQPLNVDAIPANLAPHVKLSRSLAKQDWDAICLDTCNKANYR